VLLGEHGLDVEPEFVVAFVNAKQVGVLEVEVLESGQLVVGADIRERRSAGGCRSS
jgi:hypothetical protein